jgi:FkbM family methyltransferase
MKHAGSIEAKHIEEALQQHPLVREARVMLDQNATGQQHLLAYIVADERHSPIVGGRSRYKLPNGMAIVHQNKIETDIMYKEIFEYQAYLRHGMTIRDGDCIFDVGANIGLFTLFVRQHFKDTAIYTFEPSPPIFELLSINTRLYTSNVKLYNFGISNENKTGEFVFHPYLSAMSGYHTDMYSEKQFIRSMIDYLFKDHHQNNTAVNVTYDKMVEEVARSETYTTPLRTISSVIKKEQLNCIDFLKVDVERSELDVLLGIDTSDWMKIKQIAMEVDPDIENDIVTLLEESGYEVVCDRRLTDGGFSSNYVYATRPEIDRKPVDNQSKPGNEQLLPVSAELAPVLSADDLRSFVNETVAPSGTALSFFFVEQVPQAGPGWVGSEQLTGQTTEPSSQPPLPSQPNTSSKGQLDHLSPERRALLARLLSKRGAKNSDQ